MSWIRKHTAILLIYWFFLNFEFLFIFYYCCAGWGTIYRNKYSNLKLAMATMGRGLGSSEEVR
jgi:hypothetical protein